ncbi:hypothetical protein B0H13DRAFT_1855496 [Mycena leptocephala]|nr:hypothetical protein B0H13DRAFT_1855496 [Mycena leptocephala]
MDEHQASTEEALTQALLRAQRRLAQEEEKQRFLCQSICTLEIQLAAARHTSSIGLGVAEEITLGKEASPHVEAPESLSHIHQRQDRSALEELGEQVGNLQQIVSALNEAVNRLRCVIAEVWEDENENLWHLSTVSFVNLSRV